MNMSKNAKFILGVFSAVALTLGACSDEKSDSGESDDSLATTAMVPSIQLLVTKAAPSPGDAISLSSCPLGDFDSLVAKAPEGVQDIAASAEGELVTYVFQPEVEGELAHIQCGRSELGVYTGEAPEGDYQADLIHLLEDFVVTFEPDREFRGGTIVRFCTEEIGVGGGEFCEADWYDGLVWIGTFVAGENRSSALAEQWLLAILDDVATNLPQLAPTVEVTD